MFAVRDKRSGKFLKSFSGSFNRFRSLQYWNHNGGTDQEVHDRMWCLDSPNGAKLFKTKGGVATAFYSYRYKMGGGSLPLSKAVPWVEIVPVQISTVVAVQEEKTKSFSEEF